eukprot:SAG11_NODE_2193_length_3702_cov_6.080242_3_plen_68_part_00
MYALTAQCPEFEMENSNRDGVGPFRRQCFVSASQPLAAVQGREGGEGGKGEKEGEGCSQLSRCNRTT